MVWIYHTSLISFQVTLISNLGQLWISKIPFWSIRLKHIFKKSNTELGCVLEKMLIPTHFYWEFNSCKLSGGSFLSNSKGILTGKFHLDNNTWLYNNRINFHWRTYKNVYISQSPGGKRNLSNMMRGNLIEQVKTGILKSKVNTKVTGITTADSSYHPRVTWWKKSNSNVATQKRIPRLKNWDSTPEPGEVPGSCWYIIGAERRASQNWNSDLQRGAVQLLQDCQKGVVG